MHLEIYVPAVPIAQPRQRHRIAGSGGNQWVQNFTPSKSPVSDFKATVKHAAREVFTGAPLTSPLAVNLVFVFPRPKSITWKKRPMPRMRHTGPKDCDNLAKSVCDALNKLVFADDGQICRLLCEKYYASGGGEQPHVEITIIELPEECSIEGETVAETQRRQQKWLFTS